MPSQETAEARPEMSAQGIIAEMNAIAKQSFEERESDRNNPELQQRAVAVAEALGTAIGQGAYSGEQRPELLDAVTKLIGSVDDETVVARLDKIRDTLEAEAE